MHAADISVNYGTKLALKCCRGKKFACFSNSHKLEGVDYSKEPNNRTVSNNRKADEIVHVNYTFSRLN